MPPRMPPALGSTSPPSPPLPSVDTAIRWQTAVIADRGHAGDADVEDVAPDAEGGANMDSRAEVVVASRVCEIGPGQGVWVVLRGKATAVVTCAYSWDAAARPKDAATLAHVVVARRSHRAECCRSCPGHPR
jgi:hypothetical protein